MVWGCVLRVLHHSKLFALGFVLATTIGCRCSKSQPSDSPTVAPSAVTTARVEEEVTSKAPEPKTQPLPEATWLGANIARSPDGKNLYVADAVHSQLHRITLPLTESSEVTSQTLRGTPAQIVVTDDKILVTLRSPGALWVASRLQEGQTSPETSGDASPIARALFVVELPEDAFGLALTPTGRAVVTSAWQAAVSYVDVEQGTLLWSVDVAREPRGIVVVDGGQAAYVTHLIGSAVTRLTLDDLRAPVPERVALPAAPLRSPAEPLAASLGYAAVSNQSRLYVARHALGAQGKNAWFGAATVDVLDLVQGKPIAPGRTSSQSSAKSELAQQLISGGDTQFPGSGLTPFTQPRAIVYRQSTRTLLVAGEGDDRVAELDADAIDPTMAVIHTYQLGRDYHPVYHVAQHCAAPSGLVLSSDETRAWAYCVGTNDVVEFTLTPQPPGPLAALETTTVDAPTASVATSNSFTAQAPTSSQEGVVAIRHLKDDPLGPGGATGRKLFYNATDFPTSGGLACAGCHPEGRDDGHTWHEATFTTEDGTQTNFVGHQDNIPKEAHTLGYARRTPMLVGRVFAAGPYGWHGESPTVRARVVAGFGLHRWGAQPEVPESERLKRARAVYDFLLRGLSPPLQRQTPQSELERRGKQLFESTRVGCASCHPPQSGLTTRKAYRLPPLPLAAGFDEDPDSRYKIPDLKYLAQRAPYFHDGSALTLEQLIDENNYRMGNTAQLSPAERAALVAYLKTL